LIPEERVGFYKRACIGAVALAVAGPASAQSVIADTAAKRHVGREVTVEGTVARVKPSRHQQTVFLNFGSDYPAHTFSVWVPDSVRSRFGGDSTLATLAGKRVRASGTVWLQDGKWPAITVVDPSRLVVVPGNR
jgi:hypothetical protein